IRDHAAATDAAVVATTVHEDWDAAGFMQRVAVVAAAAAAGGGGRLALHVNVAAQTADPLEGSGAAAIQRAVHARLAPLAHMLQQALLTGVLLDVTSGAALLLPRGLAVRVYLELPQLPAAHEREGAAAAGAAPAQHQYLCALPLVDALL